MQCLGYLLHIQKINGKKKPHNDFGVKRSKVKLPPTYWLHFISDRKSLRLLITDTSDFVKIWRMIIGRHLEHQRTKSLFSRSVMHAFRLSVVSIPFWWILQALVLRICGLLLKLDELSMFWNIPFPSNRLFYIHMTRKVRYRAGHAIPSNRPTEVSLHWTGFKFGNPTDKQHA